jgi:hypothetical protein
MDEFEMKKGKFLKTPVPLLEIPKRITKEAVKPHALNWKVKHYCRKVLRWLKEKG